MEKRKIFILLSLVCGILLFNACRPEPKDEDAETSENIIVKPKLKAQIFLEASGSMQGYTSGSAFTGITQYFATELAARKEALNLDSISFQTIISKQTQTINGGIKGFINAVSDYKVMQGKSSLLFDCFEEIIARTDTNTVSALISDMIISYPDPEIKANPEINKQKLTNLENLTKVAFGKAKDKKLAVALYAYNSKFKGLYYAYNYHVGSSNCFNLNEADRTFYILLIGKPSALRLIQTEVLDANNAKSSPISGASWGLQSENPPCFILEDCFIDGDWNIDDSTKVIDIVDGDGFGFGIDLSQFPAFMRNSQYLTKNLQVTGDEDASIEYKVFNEAKRCSLSTSEKKASVFVEVKVNKLASQKLTTLTVALKNVYPKDKFAALHIVDDRSAALLSNKTFGILSLTEGINGAYEANSNAFSFKITLKKE